jgi:23S rRNA pseudouridine955/2504/2580 synthase
VHAQHTGFPILGDDKYGDFALNKEVAANVRGGLKRMFLHAHAVTLTHPISGEALTIRAALPPELEKYLAFLRMQEEPKL